MKKHTTLLPLLLAALLFVFYGASVAAQVEENLESSDAAQVEENLEPSEAIVITAFGTSVEQARISYSNIDAKVRAAYPGRQIIWAWTAHSLLKNRSAVKQGEQPVYTLQEALDKAGSSGVKKAYVLSLHVIPGKEYSDLQQTAEAFASQPNGLDEVLVTPPLLYSYESLIKMIEILLQSLPAERQADEAVIFVGHGTSHPAGVFYTSLQYYLKRRDARAFVGTIEHRRAKPENSDTQNGVSAAQDDVKAEAGTQQKNSTTSQANAAQDDVTDEWQGFGLDENLSLDAIIPVLREQGIKTVWLAPLMVVTGEHARNDIYGAGPDSWQQRLMAHGFTVKPLPRSLGENPAVLDLWLERLQEIAR